MDTEVTVIVGYVCRVVFQLCAAIWREVRVAFQIMQYGCLSGCRSYVCWAFLRVFKCSLILLFYDDMMSFQPLAS
jgi:hypothetical protein